MSDWEGIMRYFEKAARDPKQELKAADIRRAVEQFQVLSFVAALEAGIDVLPVIQDDSRN